MDTDGNSTQSKSESASFLNTKSMAKFYDEHFLKDNRITAVKSTILSNRFCLMQMFGRWQFTQTDKKIEFQVMQ